jgi:membrane protein
MMHSSRELILKYVRRRGPLLAQGIAYSLLIGSTPLLLLSVAAGSLLYQVVPQIQNGLHWRLRDYVPEDIAQPIVSHIEGMASGWAGMGIVGIVLLILVSKGIFDSFGSGLAAVMDGERHRSPWRSHLYSLLLTLLAVVFVIVISLDGILINLVIETANLPQTAWVYQRLTTAFSSCLLATVLFLIYLIFANNRVHVARAILTSLVVSVLWHLLGQVGKVAIVLFARYRLIYGVFSGAVLFLVWLQLFAHLVLLGGLFIAHYDSDDGPRGEDSAANGLAAPEASPPGPDPQTADRTTGRARGIRRSPGTAPHQG